MVLAFAMYLSSHSRLTAVSRLGKHQPLVLGFVLFDSTD